MAMNPVSDMKMAIFFIKTTPLEILVYLNFIIIIASKISILCSYTLIQSALEFIFIPVPKLLCKSRGKGL